MRRPVRLKIGNCIPVNVDEYGKLDINNKLTKYSKNIVSEPFIKSFLEYGFNSSNYKEKINERTKKISRDYADIYLKLYNELIAE